MVQTIELPKPRELFEVTPEEMASFTGYGQKLGADLTRHYYDRSLRPVFTQTTPEFSESMKRVISESGRLANVLLEQGQLDVDVRPVLPNNVQRAAQWHVDYVLPGQDIVLISDKLPTECIFGSLPDSHPLAKAYLNSVGALQDRSSLNRELDEAAVKAVEKGDVGVYPAPSNVAVAITRNHLHKSAVNDTQDAIDKCFVEFMAVPLVDPLEAFGSEE